MAGSGKKKGYWGKARGKKSANPKGYKKSNMGKK